MAENKTKPTDARVQHYLASIENEARRHECQELAGILTKITQQQPTMWGNSIVGFGCYHYKYASGREGDTFLVGFASRKNDITLYFSTYLLQYQALLDQLGKHTLGKACLHFRTLADIHLPVLEQLISTSVATLTPAQ